MVTYDVRVKQIPAQQVAAFRARTSMVTIGEDVERGTAQVLAALERAGARQSAPIFMVFHGRIDDVTGGEIEICAPVDAPFLGVGEVYGTFVPGGWVASTVHQGSYDDVGPAYCAILTWMDEEGMQPTGQPREYYLNDPGNTKPEDLLTEIVFPVAYAHMDAQLA
jgi:effector-binding domain-containing protein